jgi:hypothetical protein
MDVDRWQKSNVPFRFAQLSMNLVLEHSLGFTAFNPTYKIPGGAGALTIDYIYDPLGRLTGADYSYKLRGLGILPVDLYYGTKVYLPNNHVSYKNYGTINDLKHNIDEGAVTIVGVSWQTSLQIMNILTDDIGNLMNNTIICNNLFNRITIGHYMVVAVYDEKKNSLILLNPGQSRRNPFTEYSFFHFNTLWFGQSNIYIGFGNMITIY